MADDKEKRPVHAPKTDMVKEGDILAFTYYVKVKRPPNKMFPPDDIIIVQGLNEGAPPEFSVQGKKLIESSVSADQVHEQITTTMTKLAEILVAAGTRPFTVCFLKKDETERILRGRYLGHEVLMGRSQVEDLDVADVKERFKQVDHRTIKWIIIDGVKYTVKK